MPIIFAQAILMFPQKNFYLPRLSSFESLSFLKNFANLQSPRGRFLLSDLVRADDPFLLLLLGCDAV